MKKAVLIVTAIILAVLLTSAFTLSALMSPSETGDPASSSDTAGPGGDADGSQTPLAPEDGEEPEGPEDPEEPGEAEGPEEPEEPDPAEFEAEAAVELEKLGIMNGVGKLEDGGTDYALDKTLSRAEAMTFIARAVGYEHDGADMDYPHSFRDVPDWASGSVGYAYMNGITTGENDVTFASDREVTGRELVSFALRALGYGKDFDWTVACAFSDALGLTNGELGEGLDVVTRGQTAIVVDSMLKLPPKGCVKTLLGRLVEEGAVAYTAVKELGLDSILTSVRDGAYKAASALEEYGGALVTVKMRDIMQKDMTSAHGSVVAKDTVAVPISAIKGASYLELTDRNGADMGYKGVLGCDQELGIAYLSCTAAEPEFLKKPEPKPEPEEPLKAETGEAPEGPDDGTGEPEVQEPGPEPEPEPEPQPAPAPDTEPIVYVVSDMAVPGDVSAVTSVLGLPMAGAEGEYLGITTSQGAKLVTAPEGEARELYDVGLELWPELCPPMRPRGIDPTKPMTAITYDDGPSKTYTPMLLDLLEKYNTVATFFEVGVNVKAHPEFLVRMEQMGCEIGNHSWDHTTLTKISAQGVRDQIQNTEDLITSYTGHDVKLVRCPGGGSNSTVAANVGHPIIYWTIDTRDWEHKNASRVISSVQNDKNLDGDIILMHSSYKSTYDASVTLIPWIIEKGYQPVTVSELAYFRGVELKNGSTYVKFPPQ